MRGISEEELKDMLREESRLDIKIALNYLIQQCKEINPWLPIDENTPKTRKVLLFYASDKQQVIGWVTAHPQATHYQELPDDPKE